MEKKQTTKKIKYPYLPEGRDILYVGINNDFMAEARDLCRASGCIKQPTGAVAVKNGKIIGRGSNAGKLVTECPRWGSSTGQNYGPCKDVCKQEGHAEAMAVKDMIKNAPDYKGADIYLYGHWWCCEKCWDAMIRADVKDVYLLDKSWEMFNPEINMEMKNWGSPKNNKETPCA